MKLSRTILPAIATVTMVYNTPILFAQPCDPQEDQKILGNDPTSWFGTNVAIDGQVGIVGTGNTKAWIISADANGEWARTQELTPSDGSLSFGSTVAIEGRTAFVGAWADDDLHWNSGAVYIFRQDNQGDWVESQKIYGSGALVERFGYSLAVDQGTFVVGTPQEWLNGNVPYVGAVYVFQKDGNGQWTESARLLASDPNSTHNLGWSVDISGDTILSGAHYDYHNGNLWDAGSAYIFSRIGNNWSQTDKIFPADLETEDQFGEAVALAGESAFILSARDDDNGTNSGSVYVFRDDGNGNWDEIDKFVSPDGPGNSIGASITMTNDLALVGAPWAQGNEQNAGAVHIFHKNGDENWNVVGRITASDGAQSDFFGASVLITGNSAFIGAPRDDNSAGEGAGAAYLFDLNCPSSDCLDLTVNNLAAGERASFTITNGSVGAKAVTVYGTRSGQTVVNDIAGYCATFGIKGINQNKVIGGLNRTFDANGEIAFGLNIPGGASGLHVFFQSAQKGTCPDECMSNLVEMVVG